MKSSEFHRLGNLWKNNFIFCLSKASSNILILFPIKDCWSYGHTMCGNTLCSSIFPLLLWHGLCHPRADAGSRHLEINPFSDAFRFDFVQLTTPFKRETSKWWENKMENRKGHLTDYICSFNFFVICIYVLGWQTAQVLHWTHGGQRATQRN